MFPFNNILIRKDEHDILGRYIAADNVGDDCLLGYRKYVKDGNIMGVACLYYKMQGGIIFYQ